MSPAKVRTTPQHWPQGLQYVDSYQYHHSVTPGVRQFIERGSSQKAGKPTSTHALVVIRFISDTSHPACGQHGLFAARKIPSRTHIIDYIGREAADGDQMGLSSTAGQVHCDDRPESNYDLSLHRFRDGINIGVDARMMGNEARFINDYRGIKERANAEFREGQGGGLRMGIWSASREIARGEEIVVSYGKSWWLNRSK